MKNNHQKIAKELCHKFSNISDCYGLNGEYDEELAHKSMQRCALVALEVILSIEEVDRDYWVKVRDEVLMLQPT